MNYKVFLQEKCNKAFSFIKAVALKLTVLMLSFFLILTIIYFDSFKYESFIKSNKIFLRLLFAPAAILFKSFGISTYWFLLLLFFLNCLLCGIVKFQKEFDRFLSCILFLFISSAFFQCFKFDFYIKNTYGGAFGVFFLDKFLVGFELFSQRLILSFSCIALLILILKFSYLPFLLKIKQIMQSFFSVNSISSKIIKNTAKFIYLILNFLFNCFYAFFLNFKYLLKGSFFEEKQRSILEFEEKKEDIEKISNTLNDEFWTNYKNQNEKNINFLNKSNDLNSDLNTQFKDFVAENTMLKNTEANYEIEKFELTKINVEKNKKYCLPNSAEIFNNKKALKKDFVFIKEDFNATIKILENKLKEFGVQGVVTDIFPGPVVTLFEYKPEEHIKLSKILALENDIAMALQVVSIRILAPVPGKAVVGFELSNKKRESVLFSSIFNADEFKFKNIALPLVLGKDTLGESCVVDLATMPHLLIAGSTGSGKSVALNSMIVSLLLALSPDELKLIVIDPKRLEFSIYKDIPHLLFQIIVDLKDVVPVLKYVVTVMEERYALMADYNVKNIAEYNKLIEESGDKNSKKLQFIVLIIDELADLMITSGRAVELYLMRIAQMARAAGIHMIVATQRPSVDIITGTIKVNFPNRISFKVTTKVDSRTILDECGAEKLLGAGDMLFLDSKNSQIKRLHGAYVSDLEIKKIVDSIKSQRTVEYLDLKELNNKLEENNLLEVDAALYKEVLEFLNKVEEISISLLQRRFKIGYNRAARLIELLENKGLVMSIEGNKLKRVVK